MVWGPLSLQGECFYSAVDSNTAGDPNFSGYYALISYFLTGEYRPYNAKMGSFGRLKPKNDYDLSNGSYGAWELAARYSSIDLNDAGIQGGEVADFTLGINWYLNPNSRVTLNWVHAEIEDRTQGVTIGDGSADIVQSRFQVDF
jgi:phosphate-selective porin OprO/OprP